MPGLTTLRTGVKTIHGGEPGKGIVITLDRPRPVKLGTTRTLFIQLPAGDAHYEKGGIRVQYSLEPFVE